MLIKKTRGRMRFIGAPEISLNSKEWLSEIFEFKSFIRNNSNYQIIDNRIFWHGDFECNNFYPMLAIIGAPVQFSRKVIHIDHDDMTYWGLDLEADSLYEADFDLLKSKIKANLVQIPPEMAKNFHLVTDGEKIELHFFLEKDYIG